MYCTNLKHYLNLFALHLYSRAKKKKVCLVFCANRHSQQKYSLKEKKIKNHVKK